jgi:hypothetical protein
MFEMTEPPLLVGLGNVMVGAETDTHWLGKTRQPMKTGQHEAGWIGGTKWESETYNSYLFAHVV